MTETLTKKDLLEALEAQDTRLEKSLDEQSKYFNAKFEMLRSEMQQGFAEAREERNELRESIQQLTVTLDAFLKRLTDYEEEFTILKAEVTAIKSALKDKLGVDITL